MDRIERIRDQLRRAVDGEAWHGPALRPLLAGLSAEQAARRPAAGAHSIWELVGHLAATQETVIRRLAGEPAGAETSPDDWPPPPAEPDETAWSDAVAGLAAGAHRLDRALAELPEERLGATIKGRDHDVEHMLHGLVQHHLYHAGQVALLERAMGLEPA